MFCLGWGNVGWVPELWLPLECMKASWCSGVQLNFTHCLVSRVRGFAIFTNPLMNFLQYPINLRKALTCLGVVGGFIFWIAWVLEGSGHMSVSLRM